MLDAISYLFAFSLSQNLCGRLKLRLIVFSFGVFGLVNGFGGGDFVRLVGVLGLKLRMPEKVEPFDNGRSSAVYRRPILTACASL